MTSKYNRTMTNTHGSTYDCRRLRCAARLRPMAAAEAITIGIALPFEPKRPPFYSDMRISPIKVYISVIRNSWYNLERV